MPFVLLERGGGVGLFGLHVAPEEEQVETGRDGQVNVILNVDYIRRLVVA